MGRDAGAVFIEQGECFDQGACYILGRLGAQSLQRVALSPYLLWIRVWDARRHRGAIVRLVLLTKQLGGIGGLWGQTFSIHIEFAKGQEMRITNI